MHKRTWPFLSVPILLAAALLTAAAQASFERARLPGLVPVRWGLALDAERAFYAVGDTLHARCTLSNWTSANVDTWSLVIGGNGCDVHFEILDASGQAVWEPGTITGGVYTGPGCLFAQRAHPLPAGADHGFAASIPLVFQNGHGIGTLGAALPAGPYQLAASVVWIGPARPPTGFGPGLTYEARLPFAIE